MKRNESKIDKSQDSKVCETRPTLVCPMLYTCVPLLHFDLMTMIIWPHPQHIAPYIYLWRSNTTTQGTHQGDDKDTSTDECDGADDLFTDASSICGRPHRGRLRFAGFRLPTCQAFTFWGVSNVSNGQTKTQICLEPHPGGVGDISARLMIVNVKNSDYMR